MSVHSNMYSLFQPFFYKECEKQKSEFIEPLKSQDGSNKTLIEEFDHGSD